MKRSQHDCFLILQAFLVALLVTLSLLIPALSIANEYPPTHMCFKPKPPLFMASSQHKEQFIRDSKRYEDCLKQFVRDQYEAIRMHETAIQQSSAEWDKFAQENK